MGDSSFSFAPSASCWGKKHFWKEKKTFPQRMQQLFFFFFFHHIFCFPFSPSSFFLLLSLSFFILLLFSFFLFLLLTPFPLSFFLSSFFPLSFFLLLFLFLSSFFPFSFLALSFLFFLFHILLLPLVSPTFSFSSAVGIKKSRHVIIKKQPHHF